VYNYKYVSGAGQTKKYVGNLGIGFGIGILVSERMRQALSRADPI